MNEVKVLNPYNQELIATLAMNSKEECFEALDAGYKLSRQRRAWLPLHERLAILDRLHGILNGRFEELAMQAACEGGKPLADSRIEVARGLEGIRCAIEEAKSLKGTEVPMGLNSASVDRFAMTRREPRGLVIAVSAFNHPFNLIIHQVVPAVAVGCPILIKPARVTPLSCKAVVEALYEAGLPKGWCQMILCDNRVAEALVSDPRNSFLSFIGSGRVGWHLRSQLPPGASCALEHGGAAPVILDASCDLDKAVPSLTKGGYYHAGQVCVSVQRIFVHEAIASKFCEQFTAAVQDLKLGDQRKSDTEIGPLIQPKEVRRVATWVDAARSSAAVLCGGKQVSESCYSPTILLKPDANLQVSTQEIFGPVTCIYPFKSLDAAITQANAVDFAFQAAVFSERLNESFEIARQLEGLAVMINDHTAFRVDWMPFGGYKHSGLGVGGIGHTMRDMTLEKMIVLKT